MKWLFSIVFALVVSPGFSQQKPREPDYEKVFTKADKPAEFQGGVEGWKRYVEQNIKYPNKAQRRGTQGIVRVQFIVDKNGKVSEVIALNDPGDGLAEEAIRLIKKSPAWIPAEQNGHKVIYRHIQAFTFQLR